MCAPLRLRHESTIDSCASDYFCDRPRPVHSAEKPGNCLRKSPGRAPRHHDENIFWRSKLRYQFVGPSLALIGLQPREFRSIVRFREVAVWPPNGLKEKA